MKLMSISTPKVRESIVGYTSELQSLRVGSESKEEKKLTTYDDDSVVVTAIPKLILPFISKSSSGGRREWMIPIPFAANLATGVSGLISSAVTMASATATTYFVSLATLFDEFFIESAHVMYQPSTRYQVLPSTSSSEFNGTPLGLASTFIDTIPYTNINQMPANPTFRFKHSSSPFTFVWKNNVKRSSAVSEEPDSTHNSISWVRTNATPAQYYGGTVAILGSASSAMHATTVVGIVAVKYEVWFRAKN